jgi:predicted O-methyltransferase YrrM
MAEVTAIGLAKAGGQMRVPEVIALKELVRNIPADPVIVNIGAGLQGVSTLAMLEERPDAFIFSIDPKARPGETESLRGAGTPWRRVVRLLGRSQDIGKNWRFPMDFLFVDGDHKYSSVMRDIKLFVPWVRSGGIAAFHDYVPCPLKKKARRATFAIDEGMVGYEEVLRVDRLKAFRV